MVNVSGFGYVQAWKVFIGLWFFFSISFCVGVLLVGDYFGAAVINYGFTSVITIILSFVCVSDTKDYFKGLKAKE